MKIIFNTNYIKDKSDILDLVNDFDRSGIELGNQKRNKIKLFNMLIHFFLISNLIIRDYFMLNY